jgi:Protein of unknown function (DUF983)
MNTTCARCGLRFEREPGYFVGAIYINYAATAVSSIVALLLADEYLHLSLVTELVLGASLALVFPLWFYRYSKSLWLALDYLFNPEKPELHIVRGRAA